MVSYPCRALQESPSGTLLRCILWLAEGDSHAGRDLLAIFAAFSLTYDCLTNTDCPEALEPSWKSNPAEKVETHNSRIQGSSSPILVAGVTGKESKTKTPRNESLFIPCLPRN